MNQTQAVCDTTCVPFFQAMWHAGRAFRTQTAEQTNPPDTTRPQQAVQLPFLQLQGSGTPARSAAARIVMPAQTHARVGEWMLGLTCARRALWSCGGKPRSRIAAGHGVASWDASICPKNTPAVVGLYAWACSHRIRLQRWRALIASVYSVGVLSLHSFTALACSHCIRLQRWRTNPPEPGGFP
eukprot:358277-Chlamydomonas_euryale.AAC.7